MTRSAAALARAGAVALIYSSLSLPLLAAAGPPEPAHDLPKAASHARTTHSHPTRHAARTPRARQPAPVAREDGRALSPAPLPDPDVQAPPVPENRSPHLAPALFDLKTQDIQGDGYVYGSSPQGMDDRRAATIPGVKLTVPIP